MRAVSVPLLALLVLVACGPSPSPAPAAGAAPPASVPQSAAAPAAPPASGPVTIKVAANLGASDAGIFLAMDRGFFRESGLVRGAPAGYDDPVAALANRGLDVLAP